MNPEFFVRVLPLSEGSRTARRGTGYFLSQDRVLTAAHVVREDKHVAIQYDEEDGSSVREPCKAEVLWSGGEDCDIAILQVEDPFPLYVAFPRLPLGPIETTTAWESRGWALALAKDELVIDSMPHLYGQAGAQGNRQRQVDLSVFPIPTQPGLLKGVSGAPVFDRSFAKRLFGVIRKAKGGFENGLQATPLTRALSIEAFRHSLGPEIASARRESMVRRFKELLGDSAGLVAQTIVEHSNSWGGTLTSEGVEALAEAMLGSADVVEVLETLNDAHGELSKNASEAHQRAARQLENLLALAAPLLSESLFARDLPSVPGGVLLHLPVLTVTLAELAVAYFEGRPCALRPREGDSPVGFPKLAGLNEAGIGADCTHLIKAYGDHLKGEVLSEEDHHLLTRLEAKDKPEGKKALAMLFRLIDDEFRREVSRKSTALRRYFLYEPEFGEAQPDFILQLQEKLPSIRVIELAGILDGDHVRERSISRPIRDVLSRAAKPAELAEER